MKFSPGFAEQVPFSFLNASSKHWQWSAPETSFMHSPSPQPYLRIFIFRKYAPLTSRIDPQFFPSPIGVLGIGLMFFFGHSIPVMQSRETRSGPSHTPWPVQHFLVRIFIPVPQVWLHIDHVDQPLHRSCGLEGIDLKNI